MTVRFSRYSELEGITKIPIGVSWEEIEKARQMPRMIGHSVNRNHRIRVIEISPDDLEENREAAAMCEAQRKKRELEEGRRERVGAMAKNDPDLADLLTLVIELGSYERTAWALGLNARTIRDLCNGVNWPSARTRQALREHRQRGNAK